MLPEQFQLPLGDRVLPLGFQFLELGFERGIFLGDAFPLLQRGDVQRTVLKGQPIVLVKGPLKDRFEAVVVAVRDGIVFVRMAAAAFHRQPHHAGTHDLDRIANHAEPFRDKVHRPRTRLINPHPQKPGGDQVVHHLLRDDRGVFVIGELIARELLQQKPVVRLVAVEGPDYIVAVLPGDFAHRVGRHAAFGVRITRHIEPISAPAFPIMRRGEKLIDHLGIPIGILAFMPFLPLFERGRHADEIQISSADERVAICFGRERQPLRFQFFQDELIDGIGVSICLRWLEGPVLSVFVGDERIGFGGGDIGNNFYHRRARGDPFAKRFDFRNRRPLHEKLEQ